MKFLKEYGIITLGNILIIIAFEFFFFPNQIASGGVSGLALVINNMLGIEPGIVMVVCNVILFILAFVFIGGGFGIKSMYAAFSLSIASFTAFWTSSLVTMSPTVNFNELALMSRLPSSLNNR